MKQIKELLAKLKTADEKEQIKLLLEFSEKQKHQLENERKTNETLKESEEKYRLLAETMQDVVVRISTTGKLLYVSPSVTKFGGYIPDEEIGNHISKYFSKKTDLSRALKLLAEVVISKKSGNFEFLFKPKSRDPFPVEHTYVPLIKSGKVYAIQMVLRDITERKAIEKTLKANEESYRNIFDNNPLPLAEEDWSESKELLEQEKAKGITINKEYFDENPKFFNKCISAIKVIQVNQAILDLLKYKTSDDLINNISNLFIERTLETNKNELISIANDEFTFKEETELLDSEGNLITAIVQFKTIGNYKKVIFSVIDITERKKAEQSQKESEEKLKLFMNNLPGCVFIKNDKGKYIFLNRYFETIYGFDITKLIGKSDEEIWGKEKGLRYFDYDNKVKKNSKPILVEDKIEINGKKYNWLTSKFNLPNGYIAGVSFDISKQKVAEQALKESEEHYKLLFDLLPYGGEAVDTKGKIIDCSKNTAKMLGYEIDEIVGKHITKFIDEDTVKTFKQNFPKLLNGESLSLEASFVHKNGHKINVLRSAQPICNAENEVTGALIISTDITERKKAEEELQKEKEYYSSFVSSLNDWVWEMDLEGKHTYSNSEVETILGYKVDEVIGKSVTELWTDSDKKNNSVKILKQTLAEGTGWKNAVGRFQHKNGTIITTESSASPRFDSDGKLIGYRGVDHDITERKKTEEALLQFKKIVESTSGHMAFIDTNYVYLEVNNSYLKAHKKKREEIVGHTIAELMGNEVFKSTIKEKIDACISGKTVKYGDWFDFAGTGRRYMEVSYYPYYNEDNKISGVIVDSHDITERKKAENKIRQQHEFLKSVMESISSPLHIINVKDYTIAMANSASSIKLTSKKTTCYKATHYNDEPCSGKDHPCPLQIVRETKKPVVVEHIHIDEKGKKRIFEVHGYPIFDEEGNVTQLIEYSLDITESKKAEEKLKESEANLRAIFENKGTATGIFREDKIITKCNAKFAEMCGYSKQEIEGKMYWSDFIVKEDLERLLKYNHQRTTKTGNPPTQYECRIINKNGNKIVCLLNVGLVGKNRIVSLIDITESKKIEEELKASEDRLSKTLLAANDGMWDWNLITNKVYFDPRYYEMAGYAVDEFPHELEEFQKRIHPDDVENVMFQAQQHLEGKIDRFRVEFRFKKKNGDWFWVMGRGLIVERDKNNKPLRFIGTHSDITERKQAEEELKISRERLKILNKIIRHDLSNDFSVIKSAINIFRRNSNADMLDEIDKRVIKSMKTIKNYKKYENFIDTNTGLQEIEISKFLNNFITGFPHIKFSLTGEGRVYADDALNSVFSNLVSNSVKHGNSTRIDIEISEEDDMCRIKFADNGIGIPDKIKNKIYDEGFFFGKTGNTGIGLHIVRKTIEQFGGTVSVEDNQPEGAIFNIYLRRVIGENEN